MIHNILATASDPKVAFEIGGLTVRWYGLIIVCGMLLGLLYACSQARKIKLTPDDGVELFLWVIPLAIVFARLFYVTSRVDEFFPMRSWDDFVNAIAIWDGGITIIGGIVGGAIGVLLFTIHHRKETSFFNVADLVVVPLLTGQIVGRLGNFVNQEAFGFFVSDPRFQHFPFAVYITDPSGVKRTELLGDIPGWYCATFFYEMVWNTIGLIFCLTFWFKGKQKKYPGVMLLFYFFWYFLGRTWLEYLRLDAANVQGAMAGCIVVVVLAIVLGAVYIAYRISKMSYDSVRALAVKDSLAGSALTEFDVKNYMFVGKLYAVKTREVKNADGGVSQKETRNVLRYLYGRAEYVPVDFDALSYYHVPKQYKKRFRTIVKEEEFSRADMA